MNRNTLIDNHFVATANTIESLAAAIFAADDSSFIGRGDYLRALVATTQAKLGSEPRTHNRKGPKIQPEDAAEHVKALDSVHEVFLKAVNVAAKEAIKVADKTAGRDLQSMTGFARSAAASVRSYIRAHNDIRLVAAGAVTKRMLAVPTRRRKLTEKALRRKVQNMSVDLETAAKMLMTLNKDTAREVLQPVLQLLARNLGLTQHPTKDADTAADEGRAWATKTGVFVPVGALQ